MPRLGSLKKLRRGAAAFCLRGKAGLHLIIITHVAAIHGAGAGRSLLTLFFFWSRNPCAVKSCCILEQRPPQTSEGEKVERPLIACRYKSVLVTIEEGGEDSR